MSIITLTTDLGNRDHYVSSVKASIMRQLSNVKIIDISHDIPPFNIRHAAFVLKNVYKEFPNNTIHIIGVDAETKNNVNHLAVFANNQYFICADNGILPLAVEIKPDKIVELNLTQDSDNHNFPTKDIFAKAACHISRGGTLELIGNIIDDYSNKKTNFQPLFDKNVIKGSVIHIDNYGNAITNISRKLIKDISKGRNYKIFVGKKNFYVIEKVFQKYNDVPVGEATALFVCDNLLSISMNQGSASTLMGISLNDIIRIEFHD
jgi:S-adenosylmethionine hydrolase